MPTRELTPPRRTRAVPQAQETLRRRVAALQRLEKEKAPPALELPLELPLELRHRKVALIPQETPRLREALPPPPPGKEKVPPPGPGPEARHKRAVPRARVTLRPREVHQHPPRLERAREPRPEETQHRRAALPAPPGPGPRRQEMPARREPALVPKEQATLQRLVLTPLPRRPRREQPARGRRMERVTMLLLVMMRKRITRYEPNRS